MVSSASSPSMTSFWKSSLKTSRTILMSRSGSLCSSAGAWTDSTAVLISAPLRGEALHVEGQLLLGRALGGGAHDDAGVIREAPL